MKRLRHSSPGTEKPGLLDACGKLRDFSGHVPDRGGAALAPENLTWLAAADPATLRIQGLGSQPQRKIEPQP